MKNNIKFVKFHYVKIILLSLNLLYNVIICYVRYISVMLLQRCHILYILGFN